MKHWIEGSIIISNTNWIEGNVSGKAQAEIDRDKKMSKNQEEIHNLRRTWIAITPFHSFHTGRIGLPSMLS